MKLSEICIVRETADIFVWKSYYVAGIQRQEMKRIMEALLFATSEPVTLKENPRHCQNLSRYYPLPN